MTMNSPLHWLQSLPSDKLEAMEAKIAASLKLRADRNRIRAYRPYPKQLAFHAAGLAKRERLFMAGNQLGKTLAGGAESAIHLTGRYPDKSAAWPNGWEGRVFDKPPRAWAASETAEVTRDGVQRILMGDPKDESQWGTGFIPHDALKDWGRRMGVKDALDYVTVRWGGGGDVTNYATLGFKSYDQGRTKFQVETLDFVWLDEEPEEDIYTEALTRTNATNGFLMMTFTPLKGVSKVVGRFILAGAEDTGAEDRAVINMTIDDVDHYTPERRAQIIAGYPAHERKARARGEPTFGSGLIFPIDDEEIACDPIEIPDHWARIGAMDFGWDHPFAAVELALDRDTDIVYVTKAYRVSERTPVFHAAALKGWGGGANQWLPWAWPRDGRRETLEGAGVALAKQYQDQGLQMLPEHAQFEDGSVSVEAGLMDMLDRMQTGRLKVFRHLNDWFEERRLYHRKKGLVVKLRDDLMSATRYGIMSLRFAQAKPKPKKASATVAGSFWGQ